MLWFFACQPKSVDTAVVRDTAGEQETGTEDTEVLEEVDADGDKVRVKQVEEGGGLLGKLAGVLGPQQPSTSKGGDDDEYQKFLDGLGDLA